MDNDKKATFRDCLKITKNIFIYNSRYYSHFIYDKYDVIYTRGKAFCICGNDFASDRWDMCTCYWMEICSISKKQL